MITEGEAKEEIWSSVNYLFFISTSLIYRKNRQVTKIWKVCLGRRWVEPGGAWFKAGDKTKGPPAESSFLPKAVYTLAPSCRILSQFEDAARM